MIDSLTIDQKALHCLLQLHFIRLFIDFRGHDTELIITILLPRLFQCRHRIIHASSNTLLTSNTSIGLTNDQINHSTGKRPLRSNTIQIILILSPHSTHRINRLLFRQRTQEPTFTGRPQMLHTGRTARRCNPGRFFITRRQCYHAGVGKRKVCTALTKLHLYLGIRHLALFERFGSLDGPVAIIIVVVSLCTIAYNLIAVLIDVINDTIARSYRLFGASKCGRRYTVGKRALTSGICIGIIA
mmetsp:Transcript_28806/g.44784  ORF Transcript_28806/g.44784 Transcript_28806/m.44784 type:complete len:243 (-) Transcript_28806:251-979(-)